MNKYLHHIKEIVVSEIDDPDITVLFFGSRARQTNDQTSDVDIALKAPHRIDPALINRIRNTLEESTIPYKDDIIDWSMVFERPGTEIERDGKVWKRRN